MKRMNLNTGASVPEANGASKNAMDSVSKYPYTTMFMLMSVDGKISTGSDDSCDFDRDLPIILGATGLKQYYDLERETDYWSLCTGKTLNKAWGRKPYIGEKIPINLVVMDNKHLTGPAHSYLVSKYERVYIAVSEGYTGVSLHTPESCSALGSTYLQYSGDICRLLEALKKMGCDRLTLQCGGTLNSLLFSKELVDELSLVVTPVIVGGRSTPTLVDGVDVNTLESVHKLSLLSAEILKESYIHLRYRCEKGGKKIF